MRIVREKSGATRFLNVDLEIDSRTDLQPLVSALGRKVLVLRCDRHKRTYGARLEVAKHTTTADATIREFCRLIRRLPEAARRHWDGATRRNFSVGIEGRRQPSASDFAISPEAVQWAAELGAGIVITVYGQLKRSS